MISRSSYDAVSRQWRSKIDDSHDFQVVRNDSVFRAGFSKSSVFESDYQKARELKDVYFNRHKGMAVEEVFDGRTEYTPEGECFGITTPTGIMVSPPDPDYVRKTILKDLMLVRGIGPVTAGVLRRKGYRNIEDLVSHRRFREEAKECVARILDGRANEVVSFIERRHSPSHPLSLLASGLYGSDSYIFLDLETMGFFSRPVILFGIATIEYRQVIVHQFLVRGIEEELPALDLTLQNLREKPVVISYNGKTFDIPYLFSRSAFYGGMMELPGHHVDLLHASRRNAGHQLQDCRLSTIEKHILGTSRTHDIPGSMVPEFYESYLHSGNPGPLVPIVEHNQKDITSLAKLLFFFAGVRNDG
jgi:uncharacterized protein YprB with RNaseH-like and TPR domain